MSKADELGVSSSFAAAARPRSERRQMIANATGETPAGGAAAPPRRVALAAQAHTPHNPPAARVERGGGNTRWARQPAASTFPPKYIQQPLTRRQDMEWISLALPLVNLALVLILYRRAAAQKTS